MKDVSITDVTEMIKAETDQSKLFCFTFLHSTKTFDKVEHEILRKIAECYELPGNAYDRF